MADSKLTAQAPADAAGTTEANASGETKQVAADKAVADAPGKTEQAEGTKAEVAKGAEGELSLKLPEGFDAGLVLLEDQQALAKELGLKADGAQKFVDLTAKILSSAVEKARAAHAEQDKAWVAAAKADKDFGGAKYEENLALAKKALGVLGDAEFTKELDDRQLRNLPGLFRLLTRAGKQLSEDPIVGSNSSSDSAQSSELSDAEWFPATHAQRQQSQRR